MAAILILATASTRAQQFTGTGGSIPDDGSYVRFPITVTGLPSAIDSTFGLVAVSLNIVHPYDSDLDVFLVAPDSTYI